LRPVRPTFWPLIELPAPVSAGAPAPGPVNPLSWLASASAVHPRPPARVSVMRMSPVVMAAKVLAEWSPKSADLVKYVLSVDSARVPTSSGFVDVYGVWMIKVPAGIVPWMFCVSVHCPAPVAPGGVELAQSDGLSICVNVVGGEEDDPDSAVEPAGGVKVAMTECGPAVVNTFVRCAVHSFGVPGVTVTGPATGVAVTPLSMIDTDPAQEAPAGIVTVASYVLLASLSYVAGLTARAVVVLVFDGPTWNGNAADVDPCNDVPL